jgi:plasmid maintenance system antidote protein VapI
MGFEIKKMKIHLMHPGKVMLEEFLKPMGLSQNRLSLDIGVPHAVSTRSSWKKGALPQIPP